MIPGASQTVVEEQMLKGSAAFLYTWNGERYEFVTDILWKSPLGVPPGIMAGELKYVPHSTQEYLRVPGEALQEKDGKYRIQITEELWGIAFLDQNRLIVLDHPDSVGVYVDEKFVIPPYPRFHVYTVADRLFPASATDEAGRDLLPLIREKDDHYVASFSPAEFQGTARMHDLILDLGKASLMGDVILYLDGWLFPTDASVNVAPKVIRPYLQVRDAHGNWQTVIQELGFPQDKNKMVIADLKDKFLTDDHTVRIRTNMQIYWDQIFFTSNEPAAPYKRTELKPVSADLHYRGFSAPYRKSTDGPQWFDYNRVITEPKWRDLVGSYTRYGDVTPLLLESDDQYVMINSGDEISIVYEASKVPPLKRGWSRDFLLYSDGWIKDGDRALRKVKPLVPYRSTPWLNTPTAIASLTPRMRSIRNFCASTTPERCPPKNSANFINR